MCMFEANFSPQQGWEANMQARFMDFFSGVTSDNNVNSFMVMQVSFRGCIKLTCRATFW